MKSTERTWPYVVALVVVVALLAVSWTLVWIYADDPAPSPSPPSPLALVRNA